MRCDQCKFWKFGSDNDEWETKGAGFGECTGVLERWRIMDEASMGMRYDPNPEGAIKQARIGALRAARAYVQDGSEYRAELFTAPDFFCALFQQK